MRFTFTADSARDLARSIQDACARRGEACSLGEAYGQLALRFGARDWNQLAAALRRGPLLCAPAGEAADGNGRREDASAERAARGGLPEPGPSPIVFPMPAPFPDAVREAMRRFVGAPGVGKSCTIEAAEGGPADEGASDDGVRRRTAASSPSATAAPNRSGGRSRRRASTGRGPT